MTTHELRAAIRRFGCGQGAFAKHAGITPEHLSRMVNGGRPVAHWLELLLAEWQRPGAVNPPANARRDKYPARSRP